jgi:D-hydroxyproline dehydrogenase subunit gamma
MRAYDRKENGDWTAPADEWFVPFMSAGVGGLFRRLDERARAPVHITVDGAPVTALAGDTLLVALLTAGANLRESEFGDGKRAGFCLMGACQDCWVSTESGERLRACSTEIAEGMSILTTHRPWLAPAS